MNEIIHYYRMYTLSGLIKLAINVIRSRIFYPGVKIIRFPFDIRGRKNIRIGKGFVAGFSCRLEAYPSKNSNEITIIIGDNVEINDYVHITAMGKVSIGNNVLIASKVYISDCSHGSYLGDFNDDHPDVPPSKRPFRIAEIIIEDNVWLGEHVSVLPGVSIGRGTIVGANSVVSRSLPEYVIAVGSPAVPIKQFNFETKKWHKI